MRESTIENYARKRVKELGGEMRKVKWIGRSAAPDDLVMLPSRKWVDMVFGLPRDKRHPPTHFFVEFKAPGKKPTAAQLREHKRMRSFGMIVYVIDSKELVDAVLE